MLRQEMNFTALDAKNIFLEVDAGLMCFEHVETKEEVDIAALPISVELRYREERQKRHTSITVNEQGKYRSLTLICALCTLPKILAVPTPRAIPENLLSTNRVMLS